MLKNKTARNNLFGVILGIISWVAPLGVAFALAAIILGVTGFYNSFGKNKNYTVLALISIFLGDSSRLIFAYSTHTGVMTAWVIAITSAIALLSIIYKRITAFVAAGGVILAGFLVWFFFIGSMPKNYADCIKMHNNDYKKNGQVCSFLPTTSADYRVCKEKDGISGSVCYVTYYNPEFKFPNNLEECGERIGYVGMSETTCDIQFDVQHAYDKQLANDLVQKCLQHGGEQISSTSCRIRFIVPEGI